MAGKLTELQVKNAKPGTVKYTKAAGHGLTLIVTPDASKYWRLRYRFGGKARMIAVGRPYPDTTLKQAHATAAEFRALLVAGVDPADRRRAAKLVEHERVASKFGEAADAWHRFRSQAWDEKTAEQARNYLDKDMLPRLRTRPLDAISPAELAALVARIENRGAFDVAKETRQWLKAIFKLCPCQRVDGGRPGARDSLPLLPSGGRGSSTTRICNSKSSRTSSKALDAYDGSELVKACARLSLWTANRPGVTRTLRWDELDLDAGLWTIRKGREGMKRGYFHLTPLPKQAIAMLRRLQSVTGNFGYVFIGRNDPGKPLSDGAIAGMFKRIGYHRKQTAHGFRHLVSTCTAKRQGLPRGLDRTAVGAWRSGQDPRHLQQGAVSCTAPPDDAGMGGPVGGHAIR